MKPIALTIADDIDIGDGPLSGTRALGPTDLAKLGEVRGQQKPIPLTRRMTMRHHALARYIAAGSSDYEAAAATGYDRTYISILKGDPTFKELVSFYRVKKDEEFVDVHKRLATVSVDAIDILHDRLETEPDEFSPGQLMEIAKLGLDRTGFGPSQNTNVNVTVDASSRLRAARERVTLLDAERLLEGPEVESRKSADITDVEVDE